MAKSPMNSDANRKRARMLVPAHELRTRLALVGRVLRLRDGARRAAEVARRRKGRGSVKGTAKLNLQAIREAYRKDPKLNAIPFRSLYTLALAHERVGDQLEDLVHRFGQGKALEIALITDEDAELREELIENGVRGPTGRSVPVERVTIAALRAYIAKRRQRAHQTRSRKVHLPGGRRGPRVRWPEHLRRVLAPLMNQITWSRLKDAFAAPGIARRPAARRGSRGLRPLQYGELVKIRERLVELRAMLDITIGSSSESTGVSRNRAVPDRQIGALKLRRRKRRPAQGNRG